jgi:hypothetical protein
MATILFGDAGGPHISFVTGEREHDVPHGIDYLLATGSFRTPGLQGKFATKISVPYGAAIARQLERMTETLSGEVEFATGKDHVGDVEMKIKMTPLGQVKVSAEINHQRAFQYHANIWFDIDQSYLPIALAGFKAAFPVQQ